MKIVDKEKLLKFQMTERNFKKIRDLVKKNNTLTIMQLAEKFIEDTGIYVSHTTIWRILKMLGKKKKKW